MTAPWFDRYNTPPEPAKKEPAPPETILTQDRPLQEKIPAAVEVLNALLPTSHPAPAAMVEEVPPEPEVKPEPASLLPVMEKVAEKVGIPFDGELTQDFLAVLPELEQKASEWIVKEFLANKNRISQKLSKFFVHRVLKGLSEKLGDKLNDPKDQV